jgi:2'-hydroxyisoflavone reductase
VLKGHAKHYVMISTISVYDPKGLTSITEESPLLPYTGGDPLAVTTQQFMENANTLYGPMKAAAEQETLRQYGPEQTTIIRPGLIVGPGDGSFRFTYWPWRIEQGGEIVAPGDGTDPVQIIDARDLAEWTIRMVENHTTGTFNATGPRGLLTMAGMLHGIRAAFPGDREVTFRWLPWEFLKAQEVQPWQEMTTWIPAEDPESVISRTSIERAVAAGLTFRPLAQTSVDAVQWVKGLAPEVQTRVTAAAGLPAEKEKKVLEAWRATQQP